MTDLIPRHKHRRFRRIILLLSVLIVSVFLIRYLFFPSKPLSYRQSLLLVTDTMYIVSRNAFDQRWVILSIPRDTTIAGIQGYGMYTLDALWKLGSIEKSGGVILVKSLEDALGIPLSWYAQDSSIKNLPFTTPIEQVKHVLNILHIATRFSSRDEKNISLGSLLRFSWDFLWSSSDQVTIIDLAKTNAIGETDLPDGSKILVLRDSAVDRELNAQFEDSLIRLERLSIAIFNATDYPSLGNHAARIINRIGGYVVSIGNWQSRVEKCVMSGSKKTLNSYTARLLTVLFSCSKDTSIVNEKADLQIVLGHEYEQRFLPSVQTN
ncbi:hypothetical protein HY409_00695 [Candidatus Gottesmanbacteria bacterium]|nr:hypothetical protein [Candidatus Gottesmanbacteria bacterium]